MDIVINTTAIEKFLALPPELMFWVFLGNFGWIIIGIAFILGVLEVYLFWVRGKWAATHKNILLAIDIPRGNEQSPRAVENMFSYLAGAHGSVNFFEKWFEGKFQKCFSFEVVSIEGYTQFLIWTPAEYKNLVESSVYSQYPDAEISEVDDYTKAVPSRFPDEDYDLWGTEYTQAAPWMYPIKSYLEFEHKMGPSETQFKDPMAALMDLCGSLREGEQFWFQIIVIPMGFDWIKQSMAEMDNILGKKAKAKKSFIMSFLELLGELSEFVFSIWSEVEEKSKEEKAKSVVELNPLERKKMESVHMKLSKLAFEAKIRVVYVARKDVMNKAKVGSGVTGYIKQFSALDLNNLKPDVKKTMTKTVYFRKEPRLNVKKNKLMNAYINRSDGQGIGAGIYSIEELATLWHFPLEANVKAAMVQKAPGRKADAPSSLPLASTLTTPSDSFFKTGIFSGDINVENDSSEKEADTETVQEEIFESIDDLNKKNPPENLPFV